MLADLAARLLAWRIRLPGQAGQPDIRFLARFGKSSSYGAQGGACVPQDYNN